MDSSAHQTLTLLKRQKALDGSIKWLWQLADNHTVESVSFTFQNQVYTCISSQVGCNVGCPFCATGQQRMLRNLTAQEIVAQVESIEAQINAIDGLWPLNQVALAGMGEPLLNFEAVMKPRHGGFTYPGSDNDQCASEAVEW